MNVVSSSGKIFGYASKHGGSLIRLRGLFYGTTANRYLLLYDQGLLVKTDTTQPPLIAAIPLYQGGVNAPTAFFAEFEIGYLEFSNGLYWVVSTTADNVTASTDPVDITFELSDPEEPTGTTLAGTPNGNVDSLVVYGSNPNFNLFGINATNNSAGTLYLQARCSTLFRGSPPYLEWTVPAGANLLLFFGRQGIKPVQGPSGGQAFGLILDGSTTPSVLTPSTGGQWNITAEHS